MNIDTMGLLTIFVTGVTYMTVLIWIIDRQKWGMEVDGLGPLALIGILFGGLLSLLLLFYALLELPVELMFLIILLVFPVVSLLIAVQVVKGVHIKDYLSVVFAVVIFFALSVLTFFLGYPIQILLLVAYILVLLVMWHSTRRTKT